MNAVKIEHDLTLIACGMTGNLRQAHERNGKVLKSRHIGRFFKNDTQRPEKRFELYTKLDASVALTRTNERQAGANA